MLTHLSPDIVDLTLDRIAAAIHGRASTAGAAAVRRLRALVDQCVPQRPTGAELGALPEILGTSVTLQYPLIQLEQYLSDEHSDIGDAKQAGLYLSFVLEESRTFSTWHWWRRRWHSCSMRSRSLRNALLCVSARNDASVRRMRCCTSGAWWPRASATAQQAPVTPTRYAVSRRSSRTLSKRSTTHSPRTVWTRRRWQRPNDSFRLCDFSCGGSSGYHKRLRRAQRRELSGSAKAIT